MVGAQGIEPWTSPGQSAVGQFDYGRIVNWKTDGTKRILGACQNPIIALASVARFMTAASTL
jgi:hypothetical protein